MSALMHNFEVTYLTTCTTTYNYIRSKLRYQSSKQIRKKDTKCSESKAITSATYFDTLPTMIFFLIFAL